MFLVRTVLATLKRVYDLDFPIAPLPDIPKENISNLNVSIQRDNIVFPFTGWLRIYRYCLKFRPEPWETAIIV